MARLPTIGGDDGNWGTVLNDFLKQAHTDSGDIKDSYIAESHLNTTLQTKIDDIRGGDFDVADYGAVGDGVHDDTTAFQNAINAAILAKGNVVYRTPTNFYIISSTILIQPASSLTQVKLNIRGSGNPASIRWRGGNNTAVFRSYGWKRSIVDTVHIDLSDSSATGVVAWDIETSVSYPSTSIVTFNTCFVGLGNLTDNIGWRLCHIGGGIGGGDVSFIGWINCNVNGPSSGVVSGQRGWSNEGSNSLNNFWFGGFGSFLNTMVSNVGTSGSTSAVGDDSMFFYGLGGSHNGTDFEFAAPGVYIISGGRFEDGSRFLNVTSASNQAAITLTSVNISGYLPSDGILFNILRPGTLILDGCYIRRATGGDFTAAMITLAGFNGLGAFHIRGGGVQAPDPFWTNSSAIWEIWVEGVGRLNTSVQTQSRFSNKLGSIDLSSGLPGGERHTPSAIGQWYANPEAFAQRTLTVTQNTLYLHPFYSGPDGITIDQMDCNVSVAGAAGAVCRMGVFQITDQTRPFKWVSGTAWATLLLDAGTVATTSTGQKIITLGTPLVIPARTWFAIGGVEQGGASAGRYVGGASGAFWSSPFGNAAASGYNATPGISIVQNSVSGALGTFTPVGSLPANIDSGVGIHRSA